MVQSIFEMFVIVFRYCVNWFSSLVSAMGVGDIILAALVLTLVVSLLLLPIRGRGISTIQFGDFTANKTHSKGSSSEPPLLGEGD